MSQSSTPVLPGGSHGYFFVLQANETGGTGSHQAGEVHVRKGQVGAFFPDLSPNGAVTTDLPRTYYHAGRGEFGQVTFTRYGNRRTPEERLRKFPSAWRRDFAEGNVLVIVAVGDEFGIVHFLTPTGDTPVGFEVLWDLVKAGHNFGRFFVGVAPRP